MGDAGQPELNKEHVQNHQQRTRLMRMMKGNREKCSKETMPQAQRYGIVIPLMAFADHIDGVFGDLNH